MGKVKRIGIIRTDNHSLLYGACWGPYDRYEFRKASGQLDIMEAGTKPVIPFTDTEVTACWNEPLETVALSAQQFAKAFNCTVYENLEDMADPEIVDGVFIGNCSFDGEDHYRLCEPFIKKGIPVLFDKPFADNAANAKKIIDLAREYNVPIHTASILLYCDANMYLKGDYVEMMPDKNLGKPMMITCTFRSRMEWRNASSHMFQAVFGAMRELCGDYKVKSVQYIASDAGRDPNRDFGDGEVYSCLFEDGTVGIINCNSFGSYAYRIDVYGHNAISTEYVNEPLLRGGCIRIAEQFSRMIDDRKQIIHYDRMFEMVACIDAALRSRDEGGRAVTIAEIAADVGYELGGYGFNKLEEKAEEK
ncbi:MAG: Gfo/Idh/MocA family oxidoreductase [Clostridiales bacterium]|nr:Gfo/Idh/MocA family oxidoreductase [Clostridiales bacterium]